MSIVNKLDKFLSENPNDVSFKNKDLEWTDPDAYPFVYLNKLDKLYFYKELDSEGHSDLYKKAIYSYIDSNKLDRKKDFLNTEERLGFSKSGKDLGYLGRIWIDSKIITFWKLPKIEELKKIIFHFKKIGIEINNSWVIDIFNKKNDSIFVPVQEYIKDKSIGDKLPKINDEDLKKLRDLHLLSPTEKKKALDKMGVKGKHIILPTNMTVAQYHNMTHQESFVLKIIKFLNEESVTPKNKVPGGKGDKLKPKDVDSKELEMGTNHEMEHTKDREIAQEIALDHLSEDPKYYSNMKKKGMK